MSINKKLNQIINVWSLNIYSSYKDIQYDSLMMVLRDIVAEVNKQLSKHTEGVSQIQ